MKKRLRLRDTLAVAPAHANTLELPGVPCLFSTEEALPYNERVSSLVQRNRKFRAFVRSMMPKMREDTPVVLLARFFVKPMLCLGIDAADVASERVPATLGHETLDYTLSLMDLLNDNLIKNLQCLVKIHCDKYWSNRPRTLFKLMHWEEYEALYGHSDPFNTEAKSITEGGTVRLLQPVVPRHGRATGPVKEPTQGPAPKGTRAARSAPRHATDTAPRKGGSRYRRITHGKA